MNQLKIKDQKILADCLVHATEDPITVIRFVGKFRELYKEIYTGSPLYVLEVEANARIENMADEFKNHEERYVI